MRPLPLAAHRQLRKHGADLAVLPRAADPELAGLVLRRPDDELLAGCIVCGLCLNALHRAWRCCM